MSYIIVWRDSHRGAFIDTDSHEFKESYSTYEEAKEMAEETQRIENQNEKSEWYFDFKIYKEAKS